MFIKVDLGAVPPAVTLEEPDDVKRFHVTVAGTDDTAAVGRALETAGVGRVDDEHAWVEVAAVRRLAAGRVGEGWDDELAGMLSYAASKGWLDDAGGAIRAHLEWPA
jgi:hypothetical protein